MRGRKGLGFRGLCGVAAVVSYAPQIWRVWRSPDGAKDLSLTTWSLWCVTSGVTVLYAAFVARDLPFFVVSAGGLTGCLLVTAAAFYRRRTRPSGGERSARRTRDSERLQSGI